MPAPVLFPDHYFRITIPGVEIGLFRECAGLEMEFEVFEWAEGGNNEFVFSLPGRVRYPRLTLSRGLTDQAALQEWFWRTRQEPDLKEVSIELSSPGSSATRAWTFTDAFPVRWSGPRIAAHGTDMAVESLEIAHAGLKIA
jgi:phage tail-like protein